MSRSIPTHRALRCSPCSNTSSNLRIRKRWTNTLSIITFTVLCADAFSPSTPLLHSHLSTQVISTFKTTQFPNTNILQANKMTTILHATSTNDEKQRSKLLTLEEESALLQSTAEYRRIKKICEEFETRNSRHISPEEWVTLSNLNSFNELHTIIREGQAARDTLVTRNMALVHSIVTKFIGSKYTASPLLNSLSYEDLVQEGAIGLSRAVDKYDLSKAIASKSKFATYAHYWIRAAVLRCVAERDDIIRVPEHVSATIRKVSAAAYRLGLDFDLSKGTSGNWRNSNSERALAIEAGVSVKQLNDAIMVASRRRGGGYVEFQSWMMSPESGGSSPVVDTKMELKEALSKFLRPKEMEALSLRYGLTLDTGGTLFGNDASSSSSRPQNMLRDYEAEAEEELFGTVLVSKSVAPAAAAPEAPKKVLKEKKSRSSSSSQSIGGGRWGEAMSFQEVGKSMAISAEYGRRLCSGALQKLQAAAKDGHLEPDLFAW